MGRKRNEKQAIARAKETLIQKLQCGHTIVTACDLSGISKSTYYRWLEESGEDGDWTKRVKSAEAEAKDVMLNEALISAREKREWRGFLEIMARRWPNEWGARREVEVNVNDSSKKADDIVISMLEQISKPYEEANDDTEETDD